MPSGGTGTRRAAGPRPGRALLAGDPFLTVPHLFGLGQYG